MKRNISIIEKRSSNLVKGKDLSIILPKELPKDADDNGKKIASVIKIRCGDKFFITNTSNILWLCKELRQYYSAYHADEEIRDRETGQMVRLRSMKEKLFEPIAKYCLKHGLDKVSVDILLSSSNGYEVLKYELNTLIENFEDKNCLNKTCKPRMPKTTAAKKGSSWLEQNEALNFYRLLKGYEFYDKPD